MSAMLSKLMAESLHWSHFKHALLFQPQPHTTTPNHTLHCWVGRLYM